MQRTSIAVANASECAWTIIGPSANICFFNFAWPSPRATLSPAFRITCHAHPRFARGHGCVVGARALLANHQRRKQSCRRQLCRHLNIRHPAKTAQTQHEMWRKGRIGQRALVASSRASCAAQARSPKAFAKRVASDTASHSGPSAAWTRRTESASSEPAVGRTQRSAKARSTKASRAPRDSGTRKPLQPVNWLIRWTGEGSPLPRRAWGSQALCPFMLACPRCQITCDRCYRALTPEHRATARTTSHSRHPLQAGQGLRRWRAPRRAAGQVVLCRREPPHSPCPCHKPGAQRA